MCGLALLDTVTSLFKDTPSITKQSCQFKQPLKAACREPLETSYLSLKHQMSSLGHISIRFSTRSDNPHMSFRACREMTLSMERLKNGDTSRVIREDIRVQTKRNRKEIHTKRRLPARYMLPQSAIRFELRIVEELVRRRLMRKFRMLGFVIQHMRG